jgi:hypothetical protein
MVPLSRSETPPRTDETRPLRAHLYKTDRPRAIDRHIDFFGDRTARAEADHCDEVVLESLA